MIIPDHVKRAAKEFNALVLTNKDNVFLGLEKVERFELSRLGPRYWQVISQSGSTYTTEDGNGVFHSDTLRRFRNWHGHDKPYEGNIYVIPYLLFYPSGELGHWGFDLYYCSISNSFIYICYYHLGQESEVGRRNSIAVFHDEPPERVHYFIYIVDER